MISILQDLQTGFLASEPGISRTRSLSCGLGNLRWQAGACHMVLCHNLAYARFFIKTTKQ